MKLECNTVKKCLLSISQVKWYQTINDKAKRYNFPQHYSSWKVNFNPIWTNSVSGNSLKFAKTSQIVNYEIYMFIKKPLDRSEFSSLPVLYRRIYPAAGLTANRLRILMVTKNWAELHWPLAIPALFSFMEFLDKNILGILFLLRVGHCVFADSLMTKITFIEWKKQTINLRDS